MATYTDDILSFTNNDADFQAWLSDFHALVLAAGWVQTGDTGQVGGTPARPAASNYAGYRIYRRNDAEQATAPIFMKLEFGQSSTIGRPQIRAAFGTGSDGAGNLVNASGTQTATGNTSDAAGTTRPAFASDAGALMAGYQLATVAQHIGIFVERWRNSDGSVNTDGWAICIVGATSVSEQTYHRALNNWRTARTAFSALAPPGATGLEGADVGLYPWQVIHGKQRANGLLLMAYFSADLTPGAVVTVPRYGVNHPYKLFGGSATNYALGSPSCSLAMLYE